jgi:uracil-DNA glycosylase family 4
MGFVRAEGIGSLGVLIIGEAGGKSERKDGLPFRFYAQAGSQLETITKLAGFQRSQFRIANVVNCQPPNDYLSGASYELGAIEHCRVHREKVIQEMKPKCILALGEIAFRTLTGLCGPKQTISYMRGYVMESLYGIPLVGKSEISGGVC